MMRTNYVLIDYENVQPVELSLLDHENFYVRLFLGFNQSKIFFETAAALQKMGTRAEYIKISRKKRLWRSSKNYKDKNSSS